MMLADHYGITEPLWEVIGKWTNLEYELRVEWVKQSWNKPTRSDHYLMQIALQVSRVLHSQPSSIQLDDFIIDFQPVITEDGEDVRATTPEVLEQATIESKSRWAMVLGKSAKELDEINGL